MLKKFFITILFMTSLANISFAQKSRTETMGGLKFSIVDHDQSLTPFNFGNNPAWLYKDETNTFLKITPSISNSWGNLRPKYESEGTSFLGTEITGVKTLGTDGTFLGFTSYNFENRRNLYRTLKKDTYGGEAFYFADSTSGNFSYTGPEVTLMYSWELFPSLFFGGSVNYEILEGLKEIYSYAKTLYRKTGFTIGTAYSFSDNLIAGLSMQISDLQETVEAADVNLLDVEMFNYRGDTYFYPKRGSSVTQKIKKKGVSVGGQVYWESEKTKIGIQSNYSPANTRILLPYKNYSEDEEGYSAFENFDMQIKGQYSLNQNLLVGFYSGLFNSNSWSRVTKKDLLIWEWEINQIIAGIGSTYKITPQLLIGLEYEFENMTADSTKYIDGRLININSGSHLIRAGAEFQIKENLMIRFGLNVGSNEYDLYSGTEDCSLLKFTFGFGFPLFDIMTINSFLEYSTFTSKQPVDKSKKFWQGGFTIQLNTF
jgi:hypothetical protein